MSGTAATNSSSSGKHSFILRIYCMFKHMTSNQMRRPLINNFNLFYYYYLENYFFLFFFNLFCSTDYYIIVSRIFVCDFFWSVKDAVKWAEEWEVTCRASRDLIISIYLFCEGWHDSQIWVELYLFIYLCTIMIWHRNACTNARGVTDRKKRGGGDSGRSSCCKL